MHRGYRVLPRTHFRSLAEVIRKAGASLRGDLASVVLFCFPALRFDVFSPYRDSRYCGAAERGKEKQKSYNYCSAILMVHIFDPSFLCSPRYCVRFGARLRGKCRRLANHGSPASAQATAGRQRISRIGSSEDSKQKVTNEIKVSFCPS